MTVVADTPRSVVDRRQYDGVSTLEASPLRCSTTELPRSVFGGFLFGEG
ncbi:MAG: hypothetical protein K0V04_01790 [Deltaproteobacteria bacterium]|nr:hypothetical protein [Deltaproteobacteria bacterium]